MGKIFFLIFTILFSIIVLPLPIIAQQKNTIPVVLPKEEIVDNDYFAAGETVVISGTVYGNVYASGEKIIVDGVVDGDVFAAGGMMDILGSVGGDIRAVGGQVNILGDVGGSVTVVGGEVKFSEQSNINGNLAGAAGNLEISGPIGGGVSVAAGQTRLNNTIGKNLNAVAGLLTLLPKAQIGGDLNYVSSEKATIQQGAEVIGKVNFRLEEKPKVNMDEVFKFMAGVGLFFTIISLLSYLLLGVILIRLFPELFTKFFKVLSDQPVPALGIGLITIILAPVIILFLFITLIGIPFAFIFLALLLIMVYLSKIFVSYALGKAVLNKLGQKDRLYLPLVVGLIIYGVLVLLPITAPFIILLFIFFGIGGLILTLKALYSQVKVKTKKV